MNEAMTWIRKYILNRIVSCAVWTLGAFFVFYIIVIDSNNSLTDFFFVFLYFILPSLYCLAYVNYLNKKHGIWLKCFQAILLLGAVGTWIFFIFFLIVEGFSYLDFFEFCLLIYFLLLPITFFEALYNNNLFKFTAAILKFFLKKIVWVPIASIVSFAVVWSLIVMVSIGGFQNFKERTILEKEIFFEWLYVLGDEKSPHCELDTREVFNEWEYSNWGELSEFFFNEETFGAWNFFDVLQREALDRRDSDVLNESLKKAKSFLPFFKGDPQAQVQQAYLSYDKENLKGNWCKRSRWLLRAAHQGDEVAQGLLTLLKMTHHKLYDSFWLKRDISTMDLNNPVLAFEYARRLNGDIYFYDPDEHDVIEPGSEVLRYVEQSANAGYITAMQSLEKIYSHDIHFNEENCAKKIRIHEDLASQKSLMDNWNLMNAYMGRISSYFSARYIYSCLGEPNFDKAFSLLTNLQSYQDRKTYEYQEALFYLNGWAVKQDYQKAFELFSQCKDDGYRECVSYYSFMILKGMGTPQDEEVGREFFVKKIKKDYDGISCGGERIDFGVSDRLNLDQISDEKLANVYKTTREKAVEKEKKREEVLTRVVKCIKDADGETLLAIVELHIRNRFSKYMANDELLATLNVLGEPQ